MNVSSLVVRLLLGCVEVEEFFSQPGVVICFDLNFGQWTEGISVVGGGKKRDDEEN